MSSRFPPSPNQPERPAVLRIAVLAAVALAASVLPSAAQQPTRRLKDPFAGRERPEVVAAAIFVRPYGFEPREIEVSEGLVTFLVYNRAGADELNLVIERDVDGQRATRLKLQEDVFQRKQRKWNPTVNLSPGVYFVRDPRRPKWECKVTVFESESR